ncbi:MULTISPECIES: C45 family peptidase [unclassified Microbacterium]|uniref:C45 family autoproteolytic acyltransferase/hydolase n=1 Tax=unclassified Microbacterium TaxID=2609290 RepID=UPI0012F93F45|nr:C45 family peptidase [Microbacterium sp. MAH-37]MVQ40620.1 cysteine protease [Microbacterium sp. MAH-37]
MEIAHLEPVSGLAWSVFRGGRAEVMRALGSEHADAIRAFRDLQGGTWEAQMRRADGVAAARFDAVIASTRRLLPVESQELAWIAEGAGIPERDMWARNLRGDLGRDGTGCSDLALTTDAGVLMGHNEDGSGELHEAIRLVTLDIEGDPAITAVWYPGMLPSNAFVTTTAGLAFGMDHVPVVTANTEGAGRHFVARHAQRRQSGDSARAALSEVPCAGGFAFDIADADGRADLIENAGGRVARTSGAYRHTNHLRLIDGTADGLAVPDDDVWLQESRNRLSVLHGCGTPATADEVFAALRMPGVLGRSDDMWTFVTAVVDTAADEVLLAGSGALWRGRWSAFARGERVTL